MATKKSPRRRPVTKPSSNNGADTRSFGETQWLLDLVERLMRIPAASGQEGEIAQFVRSALLEAGATDEAIAFDTAHKESPHGGTCGNLILKLPGTVRRPRRMLMAHLDTVPICVGSQPKRVKGQFVSSLPDRGIGADNRGGVATVLSAALRILRDGSPHPPLTFLWTVQEEVGLYGARHANLRMLGKPSLAFNWDGGNPIALTIGATGAYRLMIRIRGLASHAGNAPEKGVSAIAIAATAIAELHREGWHGRVDRDGGLGTSNIGVIQGGDATNVVIDRLWIKAEARSHDPKFRQRIAKEIVRAFDHAARTIRSVDGKKGSVEVELSADYESFRLASDEACVNAARAAVESLGWKPEERIANGGLDANWLSARGIPTVTLGCGQREVHTVNEALEISEFLQACAIAHRLATDVEER